MTATRTTLFGIFVLAGRPLTAAQLIALAAPLRITATNVKSHLTRMVFEGALDRKGPARSAVYGPSVRQLNVAAGIGVRLEDRSPPWSGAWVLLAQDLPSGRSEKAEAAAALIFDGFRQIAAGLYARPDWPGDWARRRAAAHARKAGYVFIATPCVGDAQKLCAAYDLDDLDAQAHELADMIDARRGVRSGEKAFAARIEIGGAVAQFMGHDPLLPSRIWAGRTGVKRLTAAYRRFETSTAPAADRFLSGILGAGAAHVARAPNRRTDTHVEA